MTRTVEQRDRMLASVSSLVIMLDAAAAAICAAIPGVFTELESTVSVIALCLLLIAAGVYLQHRASPIPVVVVLATSVIAIGVVALTSGAHGGGPASVVTLIAAASSGSAFLLAVDARRRVILVVAFIVVVGVVLATAIAIRGNVTTMVFVTLGTWTFCAGIGVWITRVVQQTVERIEGMSDAYRTERQASEFEARRRQSARLLHDTVLATLTLLAHSGRGVGEKALRAQAAEDAALLRQLRLGYTPDPASSGDYRLRQVQESTLGNTLETVKQRFKRMGLDVEWHGTGHVLLPAETLDAFLLALAECLENVRRHSGETQAHVTITDDDVTVRAMVTDSGVGFDVGAVSPGRLGFTESIVARVRDVGGNARLFSAPGSGTTVVLEVPKQ